MILLALFSGGVGILIYYKVWFELTNEEISYRGIWRSPITLTWSEIESIKFSLWSSSIVFKNKENKKVCAHTHLQGITQIIEMIEKKKGLTKKRH